MGDPRERSMKRKAAGVRRGATASLAVLLATALVGVALAQQQPRGRAPAAKPRPAATATATSDEPSTATIIPGSQAPAGASTLDGGPIPAPPPRVDLGDGGVKPSPLNPTAAEMPPTTPLPAPSSSAGVDYDKLLGDIAALRARVATVGDSLFVARVAILVETDGSHARIGRMTISLDDGIVYTAPQSFHADDPTPIYEHAVAPDRHAITVDIDRRDDRDESFKDSQKARFVVDVPPDNRLTVTLRVGDDSDMGKNFQSDRSGKYDLRVRMKAVATPANVKR
jgi:hypothetical protein